MTKYPYTLGEVRSVIQNHKMEVYHRELLEWAVGELLKSAFIGGCDLRDEGYPPNIDKGFREWLEGQ